MPRGTLDTSVNAQQLRSLYLQFFQSKGHLVYPSAPLVPIDVTGRLDESLLFTGAGMVQFKPFFRGIVEPPSRRLTNCQKCLRTGDIESVGDLTHLTFFEMLGNFSFGDYGKREAIGFSWEFLTSPEWLGLDPERLAVTVFEKDDEAHDAWTALLKDSGCEKKVSIFRLGEETNYWPAGALSNGPPGPCGPNSEMFYWVAAGPPPGTAGYTVDDFVRDEKAGRWIEIWNDVFIESEWQGHLRDPLRPALGWVRDGLPDLPFKSIDTGMGVERTACALAGSSDLFTTDTIAPVVQAVCRASPGGVVYGKDPAVDRAIRIITDHFRAACFCLVDGVLPANTGRGYVLRRLIRRAMLQGRRVLAFTGPFLGQLYDGLLEALGSAYPELSERRATVVEMLQNEERLFLRTLAQGMVEFIDVLQELAGPKERIESPADFARATQGAIRTFPGEAAFRLYDTFGFPLEVTQELADEAGMDVDVDAYNLALEEAQQRSRAAHGMETVYGGVEITLKLLLGDRAMPTPTRFVGYETTECEATIVGAIAHFDDNGQATGDFAVALDQTPFYAESGGQVADTGTIEGDGFRFAVEDVTKQSDVYVHLVRPLVEGDAFGLVGLAPDEANRRLQERLFGARVRAKVDVSRLRRTMRNHTATHLLHAALRAELGEHVRQAGSYVGPDRLRFDFTHGQALSSAELSEVERRVNEQVLANLPVVIHRSVPFAEARARGAMALFGEKYGDVVRMVEVPGASLELCGGQHVRSTGEIGLFKILHEGSAAGGVRRIEAVTGEGAYEWVLGLERAANEAATMLKCRPAELAEAIARLQETQRELRRKLERVRTQGGASQAAQSVWIGEVELVVEALPEASADEARAAADRLADGHPKRVAVVGTVSEGKAGFWCKAGPKALEAGAHAGQLVRALAERVGGGGGGRPDFAAAGGRQVDQFDRALAAAADVLREQLSGK